MEVNVQMKLNSPLTEKDWDTINDWDFDCTERISFHTKNGNDVTFVKERPGVRIRAVWEPLPLNGWSDIPMHFVCSNCGAIRYKHLQKYCTDCGAEMEG